MTSGIELLRTSISARMMLTLFLVGSLLLGDSRFSAAADAASPAPASTWQDGFEAEWGGFLKLRGSVSWAKDDSLLGAEGPNPFYDGSLEGRLTNALFWGGRARFDTHYEMVLSGGDGRRKAAALQDRFGDILPTDLLFPSVPDDERRILDLTGNIEETEDFILYHRLDRLVLTLTPDWGALRVGRQAVTWGNGLLFNPMDLFNPFAPTNFEREYKIGEDMVSLQIPLKRTGGLHILYVPRRDPQTQEVSWDQTSLAAKFHFSWQMKEFDIMASKHFEDAVVGLGGTGYVGAAAWRIDATWTVLGPDSSSDDYLSLVTNLDYSWVTWGKNMYGFVELFYNGLGDDDYEAALKNPDLLKRLARGELFTIGRPYLGGMIQVELHPLVNAFLTLISNLNDPSGVIQPRATWDIVQDVQLLVGGNLYYGRTDTEYGGFTIPGTQLTTRGADSVFLWLRYYF